MKKALLLAPMGSVHRRFNGVNIQALHELGYEVHLAANFRNGEGPEYKNEEYSGKCEENGIICHSFPFMRHELKGNLPLLRALRKLIHEESFDVIHSHTETGGLIHRMLGKTGARNIYTAHGMSFYRGSSIRSQVIYCPIERWICLGMDVNIAINKEEYKILKDWNANSARFVHGIGLDLGRFLQDYRKQESIRKELGIPREATVVLSVGELDDNKNHITVLNALEKSNFYYLICGVGPNEEMLRASAKRLGVNLFLAGYRTDIPDIIHASDIFAFPSYHEGLPVALLEAMAGGLPVVCSKIRGNVDVVKDGKNGYLVEAGNVSEWKRRINDLATNVDIKEQFTKKSEESIKEYAKERVITELKRIYAYH